MSTVEKGDALRDYVARLLTAAQHANVEVEKRIGSKKVDIYFEELYWGRTVRIAVECKNYGKPLTKEYVKRDIVVDYQQLLSKGLVDKVYIVAPHEISPDTRSFLQEYGFEFYTLTQLQSVLMDFTGYLGGLRASYKEGGLPDYYMRPFFNGGCDLEEDLAKWVGNEDYQPVAILAGYGMGKTSFARHFSAKLAEQYFAGGISRIPVYIRLGDISSEQSLEGLLGKTLTSNKGVARYSFELFMELARQGMFVVLLDGFDEMKHAISWEQFKYNFEQLGRLLEGKSKVVLLGRPSAFLSDYESSLVIRGVQKGRGKELRSIDWASYREINLDMFTMDRAYEFIFKYIAYRVGGSSQAHRLLNGVGVDEFVRDRMSEIQKLNVHELIQRPVQAKMLADIAADPGNRLWSYSRFELYEIFLNHIIDREMQKPSRHVFTVDERREFIQSVAWWLWSGSSLSGFDSGDIPRSLLHPYSIGKDVPQKDILRDLVSGSILEVKQAGKFYFPHRSYQEFLVSEHILKQQWTSTTLGAVSSILNAEIVTFLKESPDVDSVGSMSSALHDFKGGLNFMLLEYLAWGVSSGRVADDDLSKFDEHPWGVVVKHLALLSNSLLDVESASSWDHLFVGFSKAQTRDVRLAFLLCLMLQFHFPPVISQEALIGRFLALLLENSIPNMERIIGDGKKKTQVAVPDGRIAPFIRLVIVGFTPTFLSGDLFLKVDLFSVFSELQSLLAGGYKFYGLDKADFPSFKASYRSLSGYYESLAISEKGGTVVKYFKDFHEPAKMVQVSHKLAPKKGPKFLMDNG
ncbi:NACHT domain-containing protein [Pseudomonas moorei]|uniref:NACHT domain-containing protein n=1 Tax=Pseudomonas moorei TaxID=395599 RepID=UPI00200F7819|nr:NACHT domain-containing protein [Pseudomonas moorei]